VSEARSLDSRQGHAAASGLTDTDAAGGAARLTSANESRYQAVVEYTDSGVVVYEALPDGSDFIIREFNRAAGRIEGVERSRAIGRLLTQVFPGVKELGLLEVLKRVWRSGRPERHPASVYRDEAGRLSWRVNYVYRLPSGEIVAVYDDVTERKQAEETLISSERALRDAVEHMPVPMMITTGLEERMLLINRRFTEVFGYGHDVLKTAEDWWPRAYPDEEYRNELKAEWIRRIKKAISEGTAIQPMEAKVTCSDGSVRDVEGNFAHIGGFDIVTLVDLTERKRAEEALHHQAAALEDANTALRVILEQRNRDRAELEQTIVTNAETTVVPLLERLRKHLAHTPEATYVDAALQTLRELVLPFAQSLDALAGGRVQLTLREREIVNLIRAGKSSSEIAETLYISPATVAFHRKNLRRKLGLEARGPSLAAHLARLPMGAYGGNGGSVGE
jgi:PAS domain S-box-containing protein